MLFRLKTNTHKSTPPAPPAIPRASCYYRNSEATKKLFQDDWLDSGDRAYTVGNDVYITGRVKELIIRSGCNFYPYELEQVVGDIDGVRKGNVAVFASPDPATGGERLVVVAESREAVLEKVEALDGLQYSHKNPTTLILSKVRRPMNLMRLYKNLCDESAPRTGCPKMAIIQQWSQNNQ